MPATRNRRAAQEAKPIHVARWAVRLGVPLLSMRFVLDTRPQFARLRGTNHLTARDARAVAAVAKTVQM